MFFSLANLLTIQCTTMPCSQFSLYRRRKEFWLKVTVLNAENMMEDMEAQNKIDPVFNIYESIPCMKNCLPEKSPCAGFPFIMLMYVPILSLFLYLLFTLFSIISYKVSSTLKFIYFILKGGNWY